MTLVGLYKRGDGKADALASLITAAFARAGIACTLYPAMHLVASNCSQCRGARRQVCCDEYHAHRRECTVPCEHCSKGIPFPDLIVSVGGDGTFLRALSSLGESLPVVGVNGGTLGFLTRYTSAEVDQLVADVVGGGLPVQPRMVLTCNVHRGGSVETLRGVNDVIVKVGAVHRLLTLSTSIGDEPAARFKADGVIVATPLGSTAYSLSAGGPIIDADAPVVVVTPLLAPSPTLRPIVTSANDTITITLEGPQDQAVVLVDGMLLTDLDHGDRVTITVAKETRLMVPPRSNVYSVLRSKLGFNGGES